ncbi:MAG: TrkA family potassium uptake protein [Clostridia bacterium]|nr:TrkA family potassium uptake protein [Clostridia bacterium]
MNFQKKSYAIFGLGRYGYSVAIELINSGADVLAVDKNESAVNAASAEIPNCRCADITDAAVMEQLGIANVDVVVIAMANHLEESILAVMLCKELGVKNVIVKCATEMNRRILLKVGADKVVFPEQDSGTRLAKNLLSSGFIDMFELSGDIALVELDVRPEWCGKSLIELDLRKKYSLNIVAINQNEKVTVNIDPKEKLTEDMQLFVIAHKSKLKKLK